jgi:hypothetical protein
MQRGGDERFARAGGGVEDDVFLLEQFQDGGFLRRIKLEPPALDVFEEAPQQHRSAILPVGTPAEKKDDGISLPLG